METTQPKTEEKKVITKRVFKPIDITTVTKKANATPKKETKKTTKYKPTKTKDITPIAEVLTGERVLLETQEGSIQKFLNECHPDIKTFIEGNEIKKVTAKCGNLIVVTKNNFRVDVKIISAYQKLVKITDNKGRVLFNDKTKVNFIKQKAA